MQAEIGKMDADKMEDEFGDLLFSIINAGRLYGINPKTPWKEPIANLSNASTTWSHKPSLKLDLKKMNLEELEVLAGSEEPQTMKNRAKNSKEQRQKNKDKRIKTMNGELRTKS